MWGAGVWPNGPTIRWLFDGIQKASFDDSGNTIKDKDFEQSTAFIFFGVL